MTVAESAAIMIICPSQEMKPETLAIATQLASTVDPIGPWVQAVEYHDRLNIPEDTDIVVTCETPSNNKLMPPYTPER